MKLKFYSYSGIIDLLPGISIDFGISKLGKYFDIDISWLFFGISIII